MILRQTDYSLKGDDEVKEILSFEEERKLQGINTSWMPYYRNM